MAITNENNRFPNGRSNGNITKEKKRQYLWDSYGQKVFLHKFLKGVETSVKRVAEHYRDEFMVNI